MVSRGSIRALGVAIAGVLLLLAGTSVVSAAAGCTVTVSPRTGVAGSVFTIHGSGFKATQLMLRRDGTEADTHPLDESTDHWDVAVRSRPGDEGVWTAELSSDECSAAANFTVTLENTDVADATAAAKSAGVPLGLAAFVLVAGAGGGLVLGRRLHAVAVHNRPL
jgi:hypothetical protein